MRSLRGRRKSRCRRCPSWSRRPSRSRCPNWSRCPSRRSWNRRRNRCCRKSCPGPRLPSSGAGAPAGRRTGPTPGPGALRRTVSWDLPFRRGLPRSNSYSVLYMIAGFFSDSNSFSGRRVPGYFTNCLPQGPPGFGILINRYISRKRGYTWIRNASSCLAPCWVWP